MLGYSTKFYWSLILISPVFAFLLRITSRVSKHLVVILRSVPKIGFFFLKIRCTNYKIASVPRPCISVCW